MQGGRLHKTNWEPELAPKYSVVLSVDWGGVGGPIRPNGEKMVESRFGEMNGGRVVELRS